MCIYRYINIYLWFMFIYVHIIYIHIYIKYNILYYKEQASPIFFHLQDLQVWESKVHSEILGTLTPCRRRKTRMLCPSFCQPRLLYLSWEERILPAWDSFCRALRWSSSPFQHEPGAKQEPGDPAKHSSACPKPVLGSLIPEAFLLI